jgi:aspartate kinase
MEAGKVPVVCGFVGKTLEGKLTTLGRGGSDTTAVLLANVLEAKEVVLVKDVAGFFSADPKRVPNAKTISALDAEEAYILVSSGSRIIHDKALRYKSGNTTIRIVPNNGTLTEGGTLIDGPLARLGVEAHPVPLSMLTLIGESVSSPKILSSLIKSLDNLGYRTALATTEEKAVTLYIEGHSSDYLNGLHDLAVGEGVAKAVSQFDDLGMLVVRGKMLESIPGLVGKISAPLARKRINIYGISTVHSSIRLFVPWERSEEAVEEIRSSFGVGYE